MTDREVKLVLGGLLHDIGKVIYRQGDDRRKHSQSGYDYLKDEVRAGEWDTDILDCVRYHHADALKGACIEDNALAYIVYLADNIASSADRRRKNSDDIGFEKAMPLQSVFNILNRNNEEKYYEPKTLDPKDGINYPTSEKRVFDESFYAQIKARLTDNLHGLEWTREYVDSLLETLEANLVYVPSSTARNEMADISLYDHLKLTAAVSSCILEYLDAQDVTDYRKCLYINGKTFYEEKAFLLYSMDISGIQDFIYTITSKNALRTLRVRSFYLEILMEHIIDCLLHELHLSRANLIYSGGGHCYILMANTEKSIKTAERYMKELNQWLLDTFQISLYVAWGYAACSADMLKNQPQGSYEQIFKTLGERISCQKSHRYSAEDIKMLNAGSQGDHTRECRVCKKIADINDGGLCRICSAIEGFSGNILNDSFFTVTLQKSENALPLPGGYYLTSDNKDSLRLKMEQDDYFVRAYGKNEMYTGKHIAAKLWVGDYAARDAKGALGSFEEYAGASEGIRRIGVLRADVDNLGQAFVSGFANPENQNRYVTLSRTATLSRQLSLFFKCHINKMLTEGHYAIGKNACSKRNAVICYSGGDDLFIVGAWNEIIGAAMDLQESFKRYTQGTLTISAGIGIYTPGYPISAIASEVAGMEECSKAFPGKDAVTLLPDGNSHEAVDGTEKKITVSDGTYSWQEFGEKVLKEKYSYIYEFFETSDERGKNFMYNLLDLIRNRGDKINFARYVYLLSRLEPDRNAVQEQKDAYRKFSARMYRWYQGENAEADCRHLKTAMNLYAYLTREKEETEDAGE